MLTVLDYALYGVGAFLLLLWLVFFFKGLKHSDLFSSLEEKEFPFKDIYGLGYAMTLMVNYQYRSKRIANCVKKSVFCTAKNMQITIFA